MDPAAARIAQTYAEWAKEALDQEKKDLASDYVEKALAKDPENGLAQQIRRTLRSEEKGGSQGEGLPAITGALPKGKVSSPSEGEGLVLVNLRVVVDRPSANLRGAAGANAAVKGTVRAGDLLQVTAELGGWYRVALPGGVQAWISADLVKPYQPTANTRSDAAKLASLSQRAIPLDTTDDRFVSYFRSIKRQIEYTWDFPQRAAARGEHGDCVIQFNILKDGRVRDIKLLRSSGFPALDRQALNAVNDSAPYNPIPERLAMDELAVTGTFRYVLDRPRPFIR